jgi:hypothetical protein
VRVRERATLRLQTGEELGVEVDRDDLDLLADATASADRDVYLSSLWCSKEALSKALGDALRYDPSRLDSPMRWPELRSGPWSATPLKTVTGHAAWLCWRCG